jgi:hypothetical protein
MTAVFVDIFSALRFDEKLAFSTKMAGEIARDLAGAIIGPISGQLDPYRLAETERLLKISSEYGERLNFGINNLKEGALPKLLSAYPSHGFVIDRREAGTLFHKVSEPSITVRRIGDLLGFLYRGLADQEEPYVRLIEPVDDPEGDAKRGDAENAAEPDGSRPKEDDGQRVGDAGQSGSEVRETDKAKRSRRKEV